MLWLYQSRYDSNRSLVGIDISEKMVEITKEKLAGNAKTFIGDMRDLNMIGSGSSAAVINYFSLHHLDPTEVIVAFNEWNRVLCKNGQLLVAVWEGSGSIDYGDAADLVALRFSKKEVESWALNSGFRVDRCVIEPVEEIPMDAIYLEATKI
jgi:ubiquinone/menaquinone biosynthesis C-methylase UbiE